MTASIPRLVALVWLILLASCQGTRPAESRGFWGLFPTADGQRAGAPAATRGSPDIRPVLTLRNPAEDDLWVAIRESFALDHRLQDARVRQELAWLERHPRYLAALRTRMERYLPYIHAQVAARGLPGELTLLPIVESALDPYAFSHGGAAGLWQFIPSTATHFDLDRDWWFDARRDPVLATEAALTYLEYLHNRFDDWYLAMAGYNAGEGNVQRALTRARGETDFFRLDLPRETRAYVPRLLALSALIADPEAFGLALPPLAPETAFATIVTHGQFDLAKAAQVLEVDVETLYDWNPALNQWSTPPDGPHQLHIPVGLVADAQTRISAVPEQERVQWERVQVTAGDTLSEIARRHRTDVTTLRRVNRLDGTRIRVGQALFIPTSGQAAESYPVARRTRDGDYRVAPGDSLWSIARAHDLSVSSLVKANEIGPKEVLRVGQRLIIPGGARDTVRKVRYGVRRGDSLARIASKFNVNIREIADWNQLDVAHYLQPGQSLLIYVDVAAGE